MADYATELAARKEINRQLDGLIRAAAARVRRLEGSRMTDSQLRNLLGVAAATDSVEEVTNFIRYQMGRDSRQPDRQTWLYRGGADAEPFGRALINDIEAGVVRDAVAAVTGKVPGADPVAVRSRVIALYVGYLIRCFVYADKVDDWDGLAARVAAAPEGEGGAHA